jgi:voltage-gated potassium channel
MPAEHEQPGSARPLDSRMETRINRAVRQRRAFTFLAATTAVLAIGTGVLARLIDKQDFSSYGEGIWWSIVTLGTVGYGDVVPHTAWGRVLGGFVIVFGVTFIAFLTAIVTSLFVSNELEVRSRVQDAALEELGRRNAEALARIEGRLDAIEERLAARGGA